jgi:hypothetical protein
MMKKVETLAMRLRSGKSWLRSTVGHYFLPLHHIETVEATVNQAASVNSIDEILNLDSVEMSTDAWRMELADRVAEILDRKRSSVKGRETCLALYIRILTRHYAEEEIRGKELELVSAFCKSIRSECSERETILAIKGLLH